MEITTEVRVKRSLFADLQSINPVLGAGEICHATDRNIIVIGDGEKTFNELLPFAGGVYNRMEETFFARKISGFYNEKYGGADPLIIGAGELGQRQNVPTPGGEKLAFLAEGGISITSSIDNLQTGTEGLRHTVITGESIIVDDRIIYYKGKLSANTIELNEAPVVLSDERFKQNIRAVNEAEINAALELAGIVYQLNSNILHFGVSAQDVAKIFEKHGLNPYEYGVNVKKEWYEFLDKESGETKKVDSISDVPEGTDSTYHYQLGVRYEELYALLFVGLKQYLLNSRSELEALTERLATLEAKVGG